MLTSGTLPIEKLVQHIKELKKKAERRAENKDVQKVGVIFIKEVCYRVAQRIEAEDRDRERKAEPEAKRVEAEMAKIDREIENGIDKEEKGRKK